jgi:polysaccharide export outer membrane protein
MAHTPANQMIVLSLALSLTLTGCQSVTMRGQDSANLLPFPEAEATQDQVGQGRTTTSGDSVRETKITPTPPTAKATLAPARQPSSTARVFEEGVGAGPMRGAPSELCKTSLPTYVVEPPDILLIDAVKLIPKPPYRIQTLDVLQVVVVGTLLGQDIAGQFAVDPSGYVDLGPAYGKVNVAGKSVDEATKIIDQHLRRILREPEVSVVLAQSSGMQQLAGEHLVAADGTINLGSYGSVFVAGMTLAEVKDNVERHLSKSLLNPKVSVDVFAFNSKVFYIISQGAGLGDGVTRVPITGNETILDAITQVNGLSRLSSKKIWIARPVPGGRNCDQILPVNWDEITAGANSATNYQILPGDRVFLAEDKMIAIDAFITKVTAPFERIMGFGLLSTQAIQNFNSFPNGNQGNNFF